MNSNKLILTGQQISVIKTAVQRGMEVAAGAKSSATHYHKGTEQRAAVRKAVQALRTAGRELPLILAAQPGTTGYFCHETLIAELKGGFGAPCTVVDPRSWVDDRIVDVFTDATIQQLEKGAGVPYVMRLFASLREEKVNNARARRLFTTWLFGHQNIEYMSIKYRGKLRQSMVHIFGKKRANAIKAGAKAVLTSGAMPEAVATEYVRYVTRHVQDPNNYKAVALSILFIFREDVSEWAESGTIIKQYYAAKTDILAKSSLPTEVLEGLISNPAHPQHAELWSKAKRKDTRAKLSSVGKMSADQTMRRTAELKSAKSKGIEVAEADASKVKDFVVLYKTIYETGENTEIRAAIKDLARKRKFVNFPYQRVGVVLDESISMSGHRVESKNTPRAIAEFTVEVLKSSCHEITVVSGAGNGQTDLADGYCSLMWQREESKKPYDAIFIVSDGYENAPEGGVSEAIEIYEELSGEVTPIYHISPVAGAETGSAVRRLGTNVSPLAINKPEALMLQISAKLMEQDVRRWLEIQVEDAYRRIAIKNEEVKQ